MRLSLIALEMFALFTLSLVVPAQALQVGDALVVTFVSLSLAFGGVLAAILHQPATHTTLPLR